MVWAIAGLVLAVMAVMALRADARFADHARLPMQFGPTLKPGWDAPRSVAVWFLPALAVLVLLPMAAFVPDRAGALIVGASMLAGQVFYHWLLARTV